MVEFLDCNTSKLNEITILQLTNFLNNEALRAEKDTEEARAIRFNKNRNDVNKFWAWVEKTFQVANICKQIDKKAERAAADILWHEMDQVKEIIDAQESLCWQAVIAVMPYAGLSQHELRGLRVSDYADGMLRVTPNEARGTKRKSRVRNVKVNDHLKSLLDEYIKTYQPDEYLFPPTVGAGQYWKKDTLSRHLNGFKSGKEWFEGKLPENVDCLSLRRSFGSMLLRAGKNEVEVASAMGNTPDMVRKHYARILSKEVDTNF